MNVTPFLNIVVKDEIAELNIVGDIGYNIEADNFEDYEKNTSDNIAKELNSIKNIEAKTIKVTLQSLGGDVMHAMAIYSLLKNSGAKIVTYLRGYNASASTIISSASNVEDIYMDSTGLYLIHKPMTSSYGNVNNLEESIATLNKVQKSLDQAYLGLGVKQEVINDLMSRNSGNGEWLTFAEAKEFGFVGNEWKTDKVSNYQKSTFENKKILIPNIFNNQNTIQMTSEKESFELTDTHKESLFTYIMNKQENLQKIANATEEMDALIAENESLKAEVESLKAELEALQAPVEVVEEEVVLENVVSQEELIDNAVKLAIKNLAEPTPTKNVEKVSVNEPVWKQIFNTHQKFK